MEQTPSSRFTRLLAAMWQFLIVILDKGWGFESQLCFEQKESRKGSVLLVLALYPCLAVDSRDVIRSSVRVLELPSTRRSELARNLYHVALQLLGESERAPELGSYSSGSELSAPRGCQRALPQLLGRGERALRALLEHIEYFLRFMTLYKYSVPCFEILGSNFPTCALVSSFPCYSFLFVNENAIQGTFSWLSGESSCTFHEYF